MSCKRRKTPARHKLYLQQSFSGRGLCIAAFGQNRPFGSFAAMAKEQVLKQEANVSLCDQQDRGGMMKIGVENQNLPGAISPAGGGKGVEYNCTLCLRGKNAGHYYL